MSATIVDVVTVSARRLAGRCADGAERDGGSLFHAVKNESWVAICGAQPGRRSAGWSQHIGDVVTCSRCLARLRKLDGWSSVR